MKTAQYTPGRVALLCPFCRKQVGTQPESVLAYYDPAFNHKGCAVKSGTYPAHLIVERTGKQILAGRKFKKNEALVVKKTRKQRSDKGKARGKYKPRKQK